LSRRVRLIVLTVGCAALLAAPATWAAETLGHATSSTFPTGGPASAGGGGFGGFGGAGGAGGFAALRAKFAGAAAGGAGATAAGAGATGAAGSGLASLFGGGASRSGSSRTAGAPTGAPTGSTHLGLGGFGGGAGGGGFGGFGGSDSDLNAAAAWAAKHGGGTVAVESQSSAATAILAGHTNVAGIGGFSGEESSVSLAWIQMEVRDGRLTYILDESTQGGGFSDGRTGSAKAIAAAERTARKLTETYDGQTFTLYRLKA
jgi:hypothetical protein